MNDLVYILLLSVAITMAIVGWGMMLSYKKAYWRMHEMWKQSVTSKKIS